VKALAADSAMLHKSNLFPRRGKADGCKSSGRAATKDDNHGITRISGWNKAGQFTMAEPEP